MHPPLRLLPDRHRQAGPTRPRRAPSRRRVGAEDGAALRHHHRRRPRRPADGGAWLYAETVRKIHELNPGTGVENLIPDFNGKPDLLAEVFESRPEVLAHNVETVPRIFKRIRPAFTYERSLGVITAAREFGLVTKSNLILGMGETREEISQALTDLHEAGCELITITQYLRPSVRHHPVERWVKPQEFVELSEEAEDIGFSGVLSGPLVRSSYRAGRLYKQAMEQRERV